GSWIGPVKCMVEAAIGRDPSNRLRMAAVDLNLHPGKPAQTGFELLSSGAQACLVHCTLHTGRTHQIRVHMAQLKHPCWVTPCMVGAQNLALRGRPCMPIISLLNTRSAGRRCPFLPIFLTIFLWH
ncbi:MAG: hypothetical protein RLZZ371_2088, partial [Pseudomonadota bacterium]